MYTRGQFAIIGKVSVKALRYYDKIGLLKPYYIDENNQYKYYSQDQIHKIIEINEYKQLGLSMEDIKEINLSDNEDFIKTKLMERKYKLQKEIEEKNVAMASLKQRITELTITKVQNNSEIPYSVDLCPIGRLIVAACRKRSGIKDIGSIVGEVYEIIARHHLEPIDSHMVFFHDSDFDPDNADLEVCIPVKEKFCSEGFSTKIITNQVCAKVAHQGSFSSTGLAHAAVLDWIKENNYEVSGSPFEKYITSSSPVFNPASMAIEVYYPIKTKSGC